jgi:hypothetical protein
LFREVCFTRSNRTLNKGPVLAWGWKRKSADHAEGAEPGGQLRLTGLHEPSRRSRWKTRQKENAKDAKSAKAFVRAFKNGKALKNTMKCRFPQRISESCPSFHFLASLASLAD